MEEEYSDLLWAQPEWRKEAEDWIQQQLSQLGIRVTGPIEQPHIRAWSTVFHVPTKEGTLFFKASSPFSAHETALTATLSRWHLGCTPHVLATDLERCWMLMTDGGTPLRILLQAYHDIQHWHRVLPLYAELQIETSTRVATLLERGIPDRRLAALPSQFEQLLSDTDILRIDQPEGLTSQEYHRLREFIPQFTAQCERLAEYGIPETLQHDDLHDNNILVQNDHYQIFDWGDSCLAHPFFSLIVAQGSVARTLALEENGPEIRQLRHRYLDSWTYCLPHAKLEAAFALAYHIGMISRTLTWHRLVSSLEGMLKEKYIGYVAAWLQEFLAAAPGYGKIGIV